MNNPIIETTNGQLYSVRDAGRDDLSHVWLGTEVKRVKGGFAPKAKAREILVRKAFTRVISGEAH